MGELYRLDFQNGKSYIGITTTTSERRFVGHRTRARSSKGNDAALYRAWQKHGEPRLHVLAVLENRELAATEVRAIAAYNTIAPHGYNMTVGGEVAPTTVPSVAAKLLGNKNAAGSKHDRSAAYKEKLSAALQGNKNAIGNNHGVGNRNAAGKRSPQAVANIKAGVARAKKGVAS